MNPPGRYRFTLQWGAETEEQVQAGEYLKNLGHRKSEFVVLAVTEYLSAHPDIAAAAGHKLKIVVKPSYTREQVEAIIKTLIEERMAGMQTVINESAHPAGGTEALEHDIDEMLKNLDIFSS